MNDRLYHPKPHEREFSLRSLFTGCLLGSVISITNVYFGLQTGWTVGASLIAAILGYALFAMFPTRTPYTVLENNITETAGAAAGGMSSACGLVAMLPALHMLGVDYPMWVLYVWGLSVASIGVFFAVPLRQQMVVIDQLRFPTGTATAETILAMHGGEGEGYENKASVLLWFSVFSGVIALLIYFFTPLENIPVASFVGLGIVSYWGFTLLMSPMMIGAGLLMGPRIGTSLLIGAVLAWGVIGPLELHLGLSEPKLHDYDHGVQGWLLWTGVAMMVSDALVSLAFSWPTIKRSFHFSHKSDTSHEHIPTAWWIGGLCVSTVVAMLSLHALFGIAYYLTLIAVIMSWILALIATRAAGETDINPISAVAKVTQLAFGAVAPGQVTTNLFAAGVCGAGATSAGDMMQDLKTGYLLGASPRKQFIAQLTGVFFGVLFSIPIYQLFTAAYDIGGPRMPAPAAHAWKAMAVVLSQGISALPPYAWIGALGGVLIAVALQVMRRAKRFEPYMPSGMAIGIAFIIPAYFPVAMFIGSMLLLAWQRINEAQVKRLCFAVASGLIVGEGLMGVVRALLTLFGVKPIL